MAKIFVSFFVFICLFVCFKEKGNRPNRHGVKMSGVKSIGKPGSSFLELLVESHRTH